MSSTAKASLLSKSTKKQQSSSTNHCNDLSRTSWTNDNSPSLSLPSLSSKPTAAYPSAVSSSLSTAAATATAVAVAAANDTTNKKILLTGLSYECLGLDAASAVLCRRYHEAKYNSTVSSSLSTTAIAATAAAADGITNNHCNLNHCNDGASTTNNNSSGSLTPVRRHITTEGRENDEKQSLQSPTTFQYKSPEDDEEDEEDNITDAKRMLMGLGYTDVYHLAPSDRERVESITKERPTNRKIKDKYYPCLSQSSVECLSHADPIDPYRWRSQTSKAVNGGITNCNMCAGLELSLMSNGTSFVFIHPSDPNRYCQAVFVTSCKPEDRWNMRQGVAIPPKNLKQKDEDLLDIHRRKLQQRKQPEVMLKRNARSKDQYADKRAGGMTWSEMRGRQNLLELDDGDNVKTIEFPDQYTDQLTLENLMSWIKDILERFPNARLFVYVGKGSLKITRSGQGVITSVAVHDDETTKNLTDGTSRNVFAINAEGNNFKKKDIAIVEDIKVGGIVNFGLLQDKIVSVSIFEAVPTQALAFTKELETMATMEQVQGSLPSGKLIICNEIVDVQVGQTSKIHKVIGGSVFVNAYVVPEEAIGVKWLLNSDRSLEFQNTLANQLTGLDFAKISRSRSEKQKGKKTRKNAVTNARHEKRKMDEIEGIDAVLDEITRKSKKQK